jgi:tellurite resistance protein TehA-like permease
VRVRDVVVTVCVVAFVALQIALPLRHLLYPGDVTWTEYGHRFSYASTPHFFAVVVKQNDESIDT